LKNKQPEKQWKKNNGRKTRLELPKSIGCFAFKINVSSIITHNMLKSLTLFYPKLAESSK